MDNKVYIEGIIDQLSTKYDSLKCGILAAGRSRHFQV